MADYIDRDAVHRLAVLVGERMAGEPASRVTDAICAAIRALPSVDPAAIREAALREAVEILDDEGWLGMSKHRILALIDKEPRQ